MNVSGEKNIAIVHFNTPELTVATIKSVWKHTPGCKITIFDNSDKRPFPAINGVEIIDNTKGQVVDFNSLIGKYSERIPVKINNDGSARHIASVDCLFDILTDGFVLLDSDVLVRKDISPFFDSAYAWIGGMEDSRNKYRAQRVEPYLLWINVPMCREHGIRFWHDGMVDKVSHNGPPWFDTGASFYFDCKEKELPYREEYIYEYIEHFAGGSYKQNLTTAKVWLEIFRGLYE